MKPAKTNTFETELFRERLSNQLNPREPLFILAGQINWIVFEEYFGAEFTYGPGQPPKPIRLMVGLMMLLSSGLRILTGNTSADLTICSGRFLLMGVQ